jgi:hypothetical protein
MYCWIIMVIIRICGVLREQSWSDLTEAEF